MAGRHNSRIYFSYMRYCPPTHSADVVGGLKKNRMLRTYVCEASAVVAARIRIEEYKMRYPQAELFATQQEAMESELFWNPEYGKRALVEMLSSLDGMTAFLNKSGRPCSFASIVAHFEALLHIETYVFHRQDEGRISQTGRYEITPYPHVSDYRAIKGTCR